MSSPMAPAETPHPHVVRVVAGGFTADHQYATWREHGTEDWLLIHTVAGSGRVTGPSGEVITTAGDSILLRPGIRHDYGTAASSWTLAYAHFHARAEWAPLLDWPPSGGGVGVIRAPGEVRLRVLSGLRSCAGFSAGSMSQSELFAMNSLESALLWLDTQNPLRGRMDERLLRVVERIGADLAGDLSVSALAVEARLSPSRLSHLFAEGLGVSPQRYVERERLGRAAHLLASTDRAVSDIARDVGMSDPLYFSRRFSRLHGISPTGYRRRRS
ncbi:helix-turn-helix domain-containing protein [Microbacterium sp. SD291]|uniref:helix-turn-helix domain-containing protein n=1 Tax=Microbacterium sp. SD291 TaxID=2782007 RepID=UPI001A9735D3|nr:helix-turn-helix domain-containing protein [Microbacterium sp. SD291]MBO0980788.1 helix-turn-helix domain-containing protein [Microbacterium sp. SD291]